ncbi:MAG TPA: exodeoxyribonuclease VII large subunit [Candidatus Avoscillospira avistercoris]|uniref:Exodeoxyribonuclease 7 large subunit n=1 Tax=Candidatus Avoscillospira avistercoris TaxID=2840707 RepID=A0A9D1JTE1_9FIRM|nr:exodeoxyribonuclease VII large subunit [Candidatus Avoscillospira avistercoris]
MEYPVYEVSQINAYLKDKFDSDPFLSGICIRGELSNYKIYPSGHHYFTLKDSEGALRAVLFRNSAMRLRFQPQNGMKVLAVGRITVYPRDGGYQLYCESMMVDGVGDLHVAYEQLKERLQAEGLFALEHKKPLPPYPHRIAVITSGAGAAIHDILRVLRKRYPLSKVLLLPVRVQGEEAPREIVGAIRYANRWQLGDVILTGRGGGSMEDLWAFNDERVARAIYESEIPVVSAVGHEPDVTIADFVADVRAATPSNGAELIAPDQTELRQRLGAYEKRLSAAMERRLKLSRQQLDALSSRRVLQSPMHYIEDRRLMLDRVQDRLILAAQHHLERKRRNFSALAAALDAMSPLKVLARGYSVVKQQGHVVKSMEQLAVGQQVQLCLSDGSALARIEELKKEDTSHGTVQNL